MRTPHRRLRSTAGTPRAALSLLVALLLIGALVSVRSPARAQGDDGGVTTLTGEVTIANPNILSTTSEPYILLLDMAAFVERDLALPPTPESQVTAALQGDLATGADFSLALPIAPQGTTVDVDNGAEGNGVQVYSVEFTSNAFGDPFLGPQEGGGWGTALSSLIVANGTFEVTGGTVVVFAPDDQQAFPTGFGDDGLFLTEDDPVEPIEPGWTVVDLNEQPFERLREDEAEVVIEEGDDGFTDLADRSFTEAFDALVDELEVRYPFTDLKGLDWDAIREEYRPRVEEAEAADDQLAFNRVIIDFSLEFDDGHVSTDYPPEYIMENIGGRLGMRLAETEGGEVIVISVSEGLAADQAGIERGAVVTEWDGAPVADAVANEPLILPESTDFRRRLQQFEFLTRGLVGETVSVTYVNPDGDPETVDLAFGEDVDGADVAANTALTFGADNPAELPVAADILPSGLGYIRVNTFFADPVLMSTAWNQALNTMTDLGVPGLVVDVRSNGGGYGNTSLYFAGSFYDEAFELNRQLYADENGEFLDIGADVVEPSPVQWDLPVAVVTNDGCASACEIFSAAMAEDPDHLIVSYTPTAGIEAGVYSWNLPGDLYFQAPVTYFERDGEVFVEGVGVPPTVDVPATAENLLSEEDVVLAAAEEALIPQVEEALAAAEAAAATPEASPAASPATDATPDAEATPENIEETQP